MKKSKLSGWRDVFSFSFIQTLKSRPYYITVIILSILLLVSLPLVTFLTKEDGEQASQIKKVYVMNDTKIQGIDFSAITSNEFYAGISFEPVTEGKEQISKLIEETKQDAILLEISENMGVYELNLYRAPKGPVTGSDLERLSKEIQTCFDVSKMLYIGMSQEQADLVNADISTEVYMTDTAGNTIIPEDTTISMSEYWFVYGLLFIVLMVNTFAGSQVATSIASDKSSKVVEYLLTSIKPLALICGKVLSMLLAVILQFIAMLVALLISGQLSKILFPDQGNPVSKYISPDMLSNINPVNLLVCLIVVSLGLVFYATLAGLMGAMVSKIEEVSEGLTLFTIVSIVGAYVGIGAASTLMASGVNSFVLFSFLFPLSSPFILPGSILAGKVSPLMACGSILLLVVVIILLALFVAKVYETLILQNGNRVTIKELLKISAQKEGGRRNE